MDTTPPRAPAPADPAPAPRADDDAPPPRLSWPSFFAALAVTLAIFFFLNPFWAPEDVSDVDENIWFSYVPIPLLVLGLLALEKKLSTPAWILETIKLTLVKFAVTYVIANVWWTLGEAPGPMPRPPQGAPVGASPDGFAVKPPPAPDDLAELPRGTLEIVVRDAAGAPVPGALVHVTGGLGRHVFPTPSEPAVLTHDGAGFDPGILVVQAHQELVLRSALTSLHTAEARELDGRVLFNHSLVAGGESRLAFPRGHGLVSLRCRAGGHEDEAALLVVHAHPFAARADEHGRVRFADVPAGRLTLAARDRAGRTARAELELAADDTAELALALPSIP